MPMEDYIVKQSFTAATGQKEFRLGRPFAAGTVNVYVNGRYQAAGESSDYLEDGAAGKVIFKRAMMGGEIISVISNHKSSGVKVISFGRRDTPDALFMRYGNAEKLKYNNRYSITAYIDGKPVEWHFCTPLTPCYGSVKKIREDIGEFIQGFTDEYLVSMLHRSSLELQQRIQEAVDDGSDTLNEKAEPMLTADPITGAYTVSFRSADNWVRYNTDIALIYARYYGISFWYGTREKSIGDIAVRNDVKLPYLDNLLDGLKKKLDDAEEEIFGAKMFATSFQKAGVKYDYETVARTVDWANA